MKRKKKVPGVDQRHTRSCPRHADGSYAPHDCPGTWFYVISLGQDAQGRWRQEKKGGFDSQDDAAQARTDRLVTIRGLSADAHSITVAEYLEAWMTWKRNLRRSTRLAYRSHIDNYLAPRLGGHKLVDLERKPQLVEQFMAGLEVGVSGEPLDPATVRRIHATLRSALSTARKKRYLASNPAVGVELPEQRHKPVEVWGPEQVGAFLDAIEDDRLYVLYLLVLMAGLRRGEAVGLRWCDVDLTHGMLTIRQQVVAVGREVQVGPPKTRSGERVVAIDAEVCVPALREQWQRQAAERAAAGVAWAETGLVFTREDGTMLRPDFVTHHFRDLIEAAGLPVIRLHGGRHTAATLALEAGVDRKVVSVQLGHSSTAITDNLYTHVRRPVASAAAAKVARLVPRRSRPEPGEESILTAL